MYNIWFLSEWNGQIMSYPMSESSAANMAEKFENTIYFFAELV